VRQRVLLNMANRGDRLLGFRKALAAVQAGPRGNSLDDNPRAL
jgi:hypothetical protein